MSKRKSYAKKYLVNQKSTLDYVLLIILGLMTIAAVFPFYQVVLLSFSDTVSYAQHPLYLLPYSFDLSGYKAIFNDPGFYKAIIVTLFVTFVGTAFNMVLSVTGAYVLSRKYLMGRKVIMNLVVFTMLFSGGIRETRHRSAVNKNVFFITLDKTGLRLWYKFIIKIFEIQ